MTDHDEEFNAQAPWMGIRMSKIGGRNYRAGMIDFWPTRRNMDGLSDRELETGGAAQAAPAPLSEVPQAPVRQGVPPSGPALP